MNRPATHAHETGSQSQAGQAARSSFERMRERVQVWAEEIAALARSSAPRGEFYRELLRRVVAAVGGQTGCVWAARSCEGKSPFELVLALAPEEVAALQTPAHDAWLLQACSKSTGSTAPPADPANATRWLLLAVPVQIGNTCVAVIEVLQRPEVPAGAAEGNLRFMARMAGLAGDYEERRRLVELSRGREDSDRLESFVALIHSGLDVARVAFSVAQEGRALLGVDRASVVLMQGRKAKVAAISGQPAFDRRANAVTMLERLSGRAALAGQALWIDQADLTAQHAPLIEQAARSWLSETGAKRLGIVPLFAGEASPNSRPLGLLVVENFTEAPLGPEVQARTSRVARHAARALANASEHQSIFLLPLWRALGRLTGGASRGSWGKFLIWTTALAGIVLALSTIPANLELPGHGTLEPVHRREVFARLDGVVGEVRAKHGQQVAEGEVLAVLRNDDLEQRRAAVLGEHQKTKKTIEGLKSTRTSQWTAEDRSKHLSRLRALENALEALDQQAVLLEKQAEALAITSPLAGEVVTWDVENLLLARPVNRGHILLSVADTRGPWRLEIPMTEARVGHLAEAIRDAEARQAPLQVSFVLATEPGKIYQGTVAQLAHRAEIDPAQGNTVRVIVEFDREQVPAELLRPGAAATVKVHCGTRPLGYVCLHDAWEWFLREVRFRIL